MAYDVGPTAGLGHKRRMQALATALTIRGVAVELVDSVHLPTDADLVVVDAYSVRADQMHAGAAVVAAVDDLVRNLAVDVLVDPSPGADAAEHLAARRVLAGAEFSLVETTAGFLPSVLRPTVEAVLVTTGAADQRGVGAEIAMQIHRRCPHVAVRLVVGPWSRVDIPPGIVTVQTTDGLGGELANADLVVTAGGVTMLESMCMGRPTVVVVTAGNQRRQAEGAAAAGAVALVALTDAAATAVRLVQDSTGRARLGSAGARLIDGHGPARVAASLLEVVNGR